MVTLQALGISTSLYVGDTAVVECEDDDDDNVDEQQDEDIPFENITVDFITCSGKPLLFMYDCEQQEVVSIKTTSWKLDPW